MKFILLTLFMWTKHFDPLYHNNKHFYETNVELLLYFGTDIKNLSRLLNAQLEINRNGNYFCRCLNYIQEEVKMLLWIGKLKCSLAHFDAKYIRSHLIFKANTLDVVMKSSKVLTSKRTDSQSSLSSTQIGTWKKYVPHSHGRISCGIVEWRLVITSSSRKEVLRSYLDDPVSTQLSIYKNLSKISELYY